LKVLNFRHFGIAVPEADLDKIAEDFLQLGFDFHPGYQCRGTDVLNGQVINWIKMINDQGFVIELLSGGYTHLAFTVDKVNDDRYIMLAPSGHRIQFEVRGLPIEFVEEPKQED
jgi:hypothetical protein